MPNKANSEQLKRFQKPSTLWALGADKGCYKRLIQMKLLPLSLHWSARCPNAASQAPEQMNKYDVEIEKALQNAWRHKLPIAQTRLEKNDDKFFARTKRRYNCLILSCTSFDKKTRQTDTNWHRCELVQKEVHRGKQMHADTLLQTRKMQNFWKAIKKLKTWTAEKENNLESLRWSLFYYNYLVQFVKDLIR